MSPAPIWLPVILVLAAVTVDGTLFGVGAVDMHGLRMNIQVAQSGSAIFWYCTWNASQKAEYLGMFLFAVQEIFVQKHNHAFALGRYAYALAFHSKIVYNRSAAPARGRLNTPVERCLHHEQERDQ